MDYSELERLYHDIMTSGATPIMVFNLEDVPMFLVDECIADLDPELT